MGTLVLVGSVVLALAGVAGARFGANLVERGDLFVRFDGGIAPSALPRRQLAPISISVQGTVKTLSGQRPPALRRIKIELNRGGRLDSTGLPVCHRRQIEAASRQLALAACGDALVGSGSFRADAAFPEQATFPTHGRILAFNARQGGREAILAHAYGTYPVPITRIIVFQVLRARGKFGTVLSGALPVAINRYGYVKAISLTFQRRYRYRGRQRSYVSAACAAPRGFSRAVFPFARASMRFDDGRRLASTLTRSCRVSR